METPEQAHGEYSTFKQEFVIMKEEMRKIKDVLREKLGVEINAI